MKSKSLLFFLEGWSNNTDSTRWPPPQKARQSKCIHKCPECQKQTPNRKGPSKYTQLLLLRNQEHLLVLSKDRFIFFFSPSPTPWNFQAELETRRCLGLTGEIILQSWFDLWKHSPNISSCAQKAEDFSVKAQHEPSHGQALLETLKNPNTFNVWCGEKPRSWSSSESKGQFRGMDWEHKTSAVSSSISMDQVIPK